MIQRRNFLTLAVAAIMTVFGVAAFDVKPALAKAPQVSGSLVSMDVAARRATIHTQKDGNVTVRIPISAKVERNGVHVSLNAFKVGDKVQAKFDAAGTAIIKFEGVGP